MIINAADLIALGVTVKLAAITSLLLLLIGLPVAWYIANSKSRIRPVMEAIIALPLVLPPTVLGFYLLIGFAPDAPLGQYWMMITGERLAFSFEALVIGSMIYSLPFVVQPLQSAFEGVGHDMMEAAHTLGAKPLDAFFTVAVPLAKRGFLTATVLGFAHTLGEFGVVLMVGGNIPGETRVISIAIYDHVEMLEYGNAHMLSAILLGFAFIAMMAMYTINHRQSYK